MLALYHQACTIYFKPQAALCGVYGHQDPSVCCVAECM